MTWIPNYSNGQLTGHKSRVYGFVRILGVWYLDVHWNVNSAGFGKTDEENVHQHLLWESYSSWRHLRSAVDNDLYVC